MLRAIAVCSGSALSLGDCANARSGDSPRPANTHPVSTQLTRSQHRLDATPVRSDRHTSVARRPVVTLTPRQPDRPRRGDPTPTLHRGSIWPAASWQPQTSPVPHSRVPGPGSIPVVAPVGRPNSADSPATVTPPAETRTRSHPVRLAPPRRTRSCRAWRRGWNSRSSSGSGNGTSRNGLPAPSPASTSW